DGGPDLGRVRAAARLAARLAVDLGQEFAEVDADPRQTAGRYSEEGADIGQRLLIAGHNGVEVLLDVRIRLVGEDQRPFDARLPRLRDHLPTSPGSFGAE